MKTLHFESIDNVGHLKVNRPKALNALNSEVLEDLENFAKDVSKEKSLRALIIQGAGDKAFVAGADIKEMLSLSPKEAQAFSEKGQRAFSLIESLPFPVVAVVQGFALGGGFELALSCDLLFLEEKAKIGLPEVTLGLFPAFGGTQRLVRAVGLFHAKEMIFSGNFYSANEALKMGLANGVFKKETLMEEVNKRVEVIKKRSPVAIAQAKELIHKSGDWSLEEGLRNEALKFGEIFKTEDAQEGMQAFIEKRKAHFKGRG